MSYRCEHGKDADICVRCWEETHLFMPTYQPPSKTEPYDGKPRIIVLEEDWNRLQKELKVLKEQLTTLQNQHNEISS